MYDKRDLPAIAAQISSHYGSAFGADNLVNYGYTVIVKPGARTANGTPVTGAGVARALAASADVFPLAVTYGQAGGVDESPEDFERGMMSEISLAESEIESGPSEEVFGFDDFFTDTSPAETLNA